MVTEPISSGVEGDWEGFHFRIIRLEDLDAVKEHVASNFVKDEPICGLLGSSAEFAADYAQFWGPFLAEHLSIVAIDKATNKIAGVRITAESRKDKPDSFPEFKTREGRLVPRLLELLGGNIDIYDKFGIDSYADFVFVSVDRQFRGRGLAMELYNRSVTLLRSHGFRLIKCIFTSPYSRRNGEKLGFHEILRVKPSEFKDEKTGELIFPHCPTDKICTLAVLKL